ncbi:MAG: DUF2258 domain-containing protein [Candidatus Nezhaarchaeota archaeon]|nr:DUF2258 domain-containing protein [Candidatus Nezhaarchaeota archaeon]
MPTLNTGLIIAGAYADKSRRVLMAQVKGKVDPKEAVRAVGELNKVLFEVIVNNLRLDKGDVVRVVIDYDVRDGQIKWNFDALRVEAFKRVPSKEVDEKVREVSARIFGFKSA